MRRLFVAGNWKMNTNSEEGKSLAAAIAEKVSTDSPVEVLVAPPFPYLTTIKEVVAGSGVKVGAQNCYFEEPGAYTGEVAVDMLTDIGCDYVILGHSERRHVLGETDEMIGKKVNASLAKQLPVILCIGELLSEREANKTEEVLNEQLSGGLAGVKAEEMASVVIAYEPVWAIGTGVTASPEQAQEAHAYVRSWLSTRFDADVAAATRIQYGGSVKPANAAELLGQPDVDGALVGGASLKADSFLPIIDAAVELSAS
ncbi:triose-phosphate isomerase [Calycomorphotria hydatis]|uniref:Triosephosphate isomerase n=1 Tax=Calycomorphotria hydatis TaxID=2528027 RepID=A0A517TC59_9PLAN|nr:triose-phosphate isomerase [Calycomorphotria hydatis]QDT65953.1 Triosephosphate isomerase [Calycomorphotria hydatis]